MNPEVKSVWLEALRSGDYQKREGLLHFTEDDGTHRFCALGVLCEVAAESGVIDRDPNALGNDRYPNCPPLRLIPQEVIDWAGWGWDDYDRTDGAIYRENDRPDGATFEDVASFIENNL